MSSRRIPHSGPPDAPIWVIGEAGGQTESETGVPFSGASGSHLRATIALSTSYSLDQIRFGNVTNYQPPVSNVYATLPKWQIEEGEKYLKEEIIKHKPKVILACGNIPLQFLTGKSGIKNWRGSILPCIYNDTTKVVGCLHPAFILRSPGDYPAFSFDIGRAFGEISIEGLSYTSRHYTIYPSGLDLIEWSDKLRVAKKLSVDIESTMKTQEILCVGFALSPYEAVTLDWSKYDQQLLIKEICENESIEKIFHFGTFDSIMLENHGVMVKGYTHDTMAGQHILNPELPRSLDFLCSTYTREPYYKGEGRANIPLDTKVVSSSTNKQELGIYNCKDVCITYEIHEQQLHELGDANELFRIYKQEIKMLQVAHLISQTGMPVDVDLKDKMMLSQMVKWEKLQFVLDNIYSYLTKVAQTINVNSAKVMQKALYDEFWFPEKTKLDKNRKKVRTANDDALVACITFAATKIESLKTEAKKDEWRLKLQFVKLVRDIRELRKSISSYTACRISSDNRVRGVYKVSSVETGRWAAEMYIDDTGFNPQTTPRTIIEVYENPVVPNAKELLNMFKELEVEDEVEEELQENLL